ncbi:MAG: AAA family ATPase, partial [Thermoguttaceae bacterium]|nr:AAA family ATPase [Thermoguttaceae bacterium]
MNRPIPLSAFARLVVMLKSIEICGFKSFAVRARLEFDVGVCALVGPKGSGKSNIVDAIKWTLGEQSAKRLRGDEMTDVIFNGSSTRQGLGSAEATLTFDNANRLLAIDADEISLTRRVYRNGDSEYLINGRAARLKDFRDLVGAVGLGAQCYAVIEQGRVEALLQSSSAQRRAVLEEAAGVSRFNAKKQEVLRRLERVEQNLLRLSDLVGEIESQLRKTKSQAGKAETYRRLSARLQKLRLETSLYERRVKQEALRVASEQTDDFAAFESRQTSEIARAETSQAQRATEVAAAEARLRDAESELGAARERIAADESTIEIRVGQIREWTRSLVSLARQSYETTIKRRETLAAESQARAELEEVERGAASTSSAFATENAAVETLAQRASELVRARDELQRSRETSAADASRFVGELSGLE